MVVPLVGPFSSACYAGRQKTHLKARPQNSIHRMALRIPTSDPSRGLPLELKLHLFHAPFPFMLHVENRMGRHPHSLPGNLDLKGFSLLQAISESSELGDHFFGRITLLDVPIRLRHLGLRSASPSTLPKP